MLKSARSAISRFARGPWLQRGFWAMLDQATFAGSNFVVNVLLARWLSPEGYGAYTVAYTLFILVGVVHAGLLAEPLLVFGSGRFAKRFEAYVRVLLSGHARFSVVAGVLLGLGAVVAWTMGQLVLGHALAVFAVGQAMILFQWAMRSACYVKVRPAVAAVAGLIYMALMVGGVTALNLTGTLNEATGIALMSLASLVAAVFIMQRLHIPWRRVRDEALTREATERHRQYGGWAVGTGVLEWFNGFWPFLLLPLWAGLDDTGALRAIYNLILPLLFLFRGLGNLFVPAFVEATANGTARRVVMRIGVGMAVFTILFAIGVELAGATVLSLLYDGQYDGYAHLLWIVAVLPLSAAVSNVAQALLRAQERPESVFAARGGAAVVMATVGTAATFMLGVFGALLADLFAAGTDAAIMVGLIRRGDAPILTSGALVDDPDRRHVFVAAFACGPGRGSEPGQGWQVASRLAAHYNVTALVYAGFRPVVEAELAQRPLPGLRVVYYRLPMERERHHARGVERRGVAEQVHYLLWMLASRGLVRRLHDEMPFDATVHASFMRYWSPSPAAIAGVPFVWGPVGGGETSPDSFIRAMPWRSRFHARARETARALSHALPSVRATARRASVALATTPESAVRMERLGAHAVEVARASVALDRETVERLGALPDPPSGPLTFLFSGRLIYWKGVDTGLRAFAQACRMAPDAFAEARFVVLGEGPDRPRLEALARRLGVRVEFRGIVSRDEALTTLIETHVQVHPSLYDSGGYATLEALAAGRPVVCLALGGPAIQASPAPDGTEVGMTIPAVTPDQAEADMAAAFVRLALNPDLRAQMGAAARARVADRFVQEDVAAALAARLDALLGSPDPVPEPEAPHVLLTPDEALL